ncbi:Protein kinase superfamily protein [Perilla frutescens var. hirtella]|uniref:non-specific serine/threonine protein kinase n=1 Tax=Perilla frutescens var. hirtella TaxID=608512 RepID=A0AAD4IQD9_PERFH|nr:Protein kinase superfamily protein [Perilla frutescens var. hirtella]
MGRPCAKSGLRVDPANSIDPCVRVRGNVIFYLQLRIFNLAIARFLQKWSFFTCTRLVNRCQKNRLHMQVEVVINDTFYTYSLRGKTLKIRKPRQDWEIDPSKLIIKSVLARGTFGTVHRGVYDGQDVAVKLLDWGEEGHRTEAEIASLRAAFTQEVAVWHKLDHPNVTKFIGATMGSSGLNIQTETGQIGMPSNICCVVVEYLPGGALKSYLIKNRRKKLAFKVVVQMALDLARGLSYLHSQKIVHRDVKTENMLLDKTRTVKIADFGVARVEASNPNDMTGETGTLGYMAPEVLNGSAYNRKCDVYSFGICLWEIYCCDMPYPDLSFSEVTSAVVQQNLRPDIPRCCPSSLANVMKRCWDANPDKRPEMDEVVSMIEAIDTSKGGGMIPVDQQQGCLCFRTKRGP